MGDNNKIAGHILPREFYRDMMTFFMDMGQNRLNHHSVMGGVVNLIGYALDKEKRVVANHQIPQEYIERAHDELIHATDRYVYNVAHLIKIHKFIPYLIERHGERIRYEDPDTLPKSMPKGEWEDSVYCRLDFEEASDVKRFNAEQRINFWEINLPVYQNIDNLWGELKNTVENSYTNLESLRFLMTPETRRRREDDIERDPFCTKFLYGRESEVGDMASRIEHYYFIRTGFILGMFTTSPKVAQHLAAQRKDIAGAKRVMDYLKSLDKGVILPAIYLKENRDQRHDNQILRQLGTECSGVIPETGIFIGDVKNRPPRDVKPRLVYQSPC